MATLRNFKRPDVCKLPALALPIYIRSSGIYKVEQGWRDNGGANQAFVQIFWGLAGQGELTIGGETFTLSAGDVAFKRPRQRHGYHAKGGVWEWCWVTFDGPGAAAFLKSYNYPKMIRGAGACPRHLFAEVETGVRDMTPFRQRQLISVVAEILALAGGANEEASQQGRLVHRFIELVRECYAEASLNINTIAATLGVHRSTLARVFKKRTAVSPVEYLVRLRMETALGLLRESDLPVAEIGDRVGIPDPAYFCRCVRKMTGMGPREYRNAGGA